LSSWFLVRSFQFPLLNSLLLKKVLQQLFALFGQHTCRNFQSVI